MLSRPKIQRATAAALLLGLFLACGESNPIIGVWVVDTQATSGGAAAAASLAGIEKVEFRGDKRIVGTKSVDVTYEVDTERVIVTQTNEGEGEVYTILPDDRIRTALPLGIVVVYRREGSEPPVAPEAEAQP